MVLSENIQRESSLKVFLIKLVADYFDLSHFLDHSPEMQLLRNTSHVKLFKGLWQMVSNGLSCKNSVLFAQWFARDYEGSVRIADTCALAPGELGHKPTHYFKLTFVIY